MTVKNKRRGGVVSRAGGGPVVSGARRVGGGRIIGEVLSGGRNISGVAARKRSAPRPTRDSARHSLRPAPKAASGKPAAAKHDDYSDFGFDDGRADRHIKSHDASTYSTGRGGIERRSGNGRAAAVLIRSLGPFLFFALLYIGFLTALPRQEFPYLRIGLIPLLLAVWCGARIGAAIRRERRQGMSAGAALAGIAWGVLIIGAGFYAVARVVGFYPTFILAEFFDLPNEAVRYSSLIDMGINRLFAIFRLAFYGVVPLAGVALGWLFGRR